MRGTEFYSSNREEYAANNGKLKVCKQCWTMHVDNWDPSTYLPLLEEADVPYIPAEWNKLMQKYIAGVPREKISGTTIMGRYLAKMKLNQWSKYRFEDTEILAEMEKDRIRQLMTQQGYSEADIQKTVENPAYVADLPEKPPEPVLVEEPNVITLEEQIAAEIEEFGLTEEDVTYLKLKWGKLYTPEEQVRLEQLYCDMEQSYDIQTAGHVDTLKLICKTSLKANQLIDLGDIEGFQKVSRVYDTLMKSGRFTASQMKEVNEDVVDSLGALVALCEAEGFIPRFYIDQPNDQVDATLQDLQNYTHSLVFNELNLGNLIENAIKAMVKEEEKEEDEDIDDSEVTYENLDVKDYLDFNDVLEEESEEDIQAILAAMRGED